METLNTHFVEDLKTLADQEDLISVGRDVNELRTKFEDYILEEERKHQVAQLEAKDRGEQLDENLEILQLKEAFYAVYNVFKDKRRAIIDAKKAEEEENLKKKRSLINQLKEVVANEENIGAAFTAHKEINAKWKEVGDIPREKRHDIQQEYSRLLEDFFYNMKIYREIKEYDFKKNQTLKEAVVEKLKALEQEASIKNVEAQLKTLQNEWEDIGPTVQEEWEKLKDAYWSTVKGLYDRIRAHYDERREKMQENIALKKELIAQTEALLAKDRESVKDWNADTKAILKLQETWKKIGFGPKKENDAVWKTFRGLCDEFFNQKSAFFEDVQDVFDEVAEKKQAVIDQVEALKDSTNWKETGNKIIQLQKRWKDLGNAGQKHEQRLWKQFRAACDHFFNAKKEYFASLDKEKEDNLTKKETLLEKINAFKLPKEQKEALDALKELAQEFAAIGQVPIKQKDIIYKAFKEAMDQHYAALNLEGNEKDKVLFEAKLETMRGSSNASKLLDNERQVIRKEIDAIKQNIIQFENNLGFFANSKGANPLKEQVEQNIEAEKKKLDALKQKLKSIPNE